MKTKMLFLMMIINSAAFAAQEIPAYYSMSCWDGTFLYNQLNVQVQGDQINFVSSGQILELYKNLIKSPIDENWGHLYADFSITKDKCRISNEDSKILTCVTDQLSVRVSGNLGTKKDIDETIDIKGVTVQVRKVSTLSALENLNEGYELILSSGAPLNTTIFAQRYFHDVSEDQTGNCRIK